MAKGENDEGREEQRSLQEKVVEREGWALAGSSLLTGHGGGCWLWVEACTAHHSNRMAESSVRWSWSGGIDGG